jgi:hypothetical protein
MSTRVNIGRALRRFDDDFEVDGPMNARLPDKHIGNHLRWVVVNLSTSHGLGRALISRMTMISIRTVSRILANFNSRGTGPTCFFVSRHSTVCLDRCGLGHAPQATTARKSDSRQAPAEPRQNLDRHFTHHSCCILGRTQSRALSQNRDNSCIKHYCHCFAQ